MDPLVLPTPDELEPRRREFLRERFLYRSWAVGSVVMCYINLCMGTFATVYWIGLQRQALGGVLLLSFLPLIGLFAVHRWKGRRTRMVGDAVRERLGIEKKKNTWLYILPILPMIGGLLYFGVDNQTAGWSLLFMALIGPVLRRHQDEDVPVWVVLTRVLWTSIGALWMLLAGDLVGEDAALYSGMVWLLFSPAALPAYALRRPVMGALERDDKVGDWARTYALFLPVAQRSATQRLRGDEEGARRILERRFEVPQTTSLMGEALLELAELETLPEERERWLAGAALLLADHPQPFAAIARHLAAQGDERAVFYAIFAEENASRAVTHGVDSYRELRESLEGGAVSAEG